MDYYHVLGVSPNADTATIKKAYRKLAKEFHPDVNKHNPHATELFQRVVNAYDILSDAQERATYDRQRRAYKATLATRPTYPPRQERTSPAKSYPPRPAQSAKKPLNEVLGFPKSFLHIVMVLLSLVIVLLFWEAALAAKLLGITLAFAIIAGRWLDEAKNTRPSDQTLSTTEIIIIYLVSAFFAIVLVLALLERHYSGRYRYNL